MLLSVANMNDSSASSPHFHFKLKVQNGIYHMSTRTTFANQLFKRFFSVKCFAYDPFKLDIVSVTKLYTAIKKALAN